MTNPQIVMPPNVKPNAVGTPPDIISILTQCIDSVYKNWDWIPYAETFLMIKPMSGPVIPFKANQLQRTSRNDRVIHQRNRIIRLKVRRHGSTLCEIISAVVYMLCVPYFNVLVTSDDRPSSERIVHQILRPIIDNLPSFLYDILDIKLVQRELRIKHKNGESVLFVGGLRDDSFGVGYDIHYAIHTEDAYEPAKGEQIRADILQGVPDWGFITRESTANGIGNKFHTDYSDCSMGGGTLFPRFYPWWTRETARIVPDQGYIPERIRGSFVLNEHELSLQKVHGIDIDQFRFYRWHVETDGALVHQYYPETDQEAFLSTSIIQFPAQHLQVLYNDASPPLSELPDNKRDMLIGIGWRSALSDASELMSNGLRIWHLPEAGRNYTIGVDSGSGEIGSNWTVAQVINNFTGEQDAVLRGVYRGDEFTLNDRVTLSQMRNFRMDKHGRLGAPGGQLDDCVDALMLAYKPRAENSIGTNKPRAKSTSFGRV
jgi:hypothetical protein